MVRNSCKPTRHRRPLLSIDRLDRPIWWHSKLNRVCFARGNVAAKRHVRLEAGAEFERRSHSILGKINADAGHGAFALAMESARRFASDRIALVGEAAHRFPPIGAQGLNLGLRDAAALAEIAADYRDDPGQPHALERYDRERHADVMSRTIAVDLMNRSLLSGFLPMQGLRGVGLHLLNSIGPLRRAMMREGVMPRAAQPRLMRGEALL